MKVFLDTNIMIDLLAERKMWLLPAMEILELTNSNKIDLFCSIISLLQAAMAKAAKMIVNTKVFFICVSYLLCLCYGRERSGMRCCYGNIAYNNKVPHNRIDFIAL